MKRNGTTKCTVDGIQCTPSFGRLQLNNARAATATEMLLSSVTLSPYPVVQVLFLFCFVDVIIVITLLAGIGSVRFSSAFCMMCNSSGNGNNEGAHTF